MRRRIIFPADVLFEQIAESITNQHMRSSPRSSQGANSLPIDVVEEEDEVVVTTDIPGFETDEIQLSVDSVGETLTIRGEKSDSEDEDQPQYRSNTQTFEKQVSLPVRVADDDCKATYRNGVLCVTLSKHPEDDSGFSIEID